MIAITISNAARALARGGSGSGSLSRSIPRTGCPTTLLVGRSNFRKTPGWDVLEYACNVSSTGVGGAADGSTVPWQPLEPVVAAIAGVVGFVFVTVGCDGFDERARVVPPATFFRSTIA